MDPELAAKQKDPPKTSSNAKELIFEKNPINLFNSGYPKVLSTISHSIYFFIPGKVNIFEEEFFFRISYF